MVKPVNIDKGGYRKFGWIDPKTKKMHNGHDFNCPIGTPVKSVADGEVVFCGMMDGFGSFNPTTKGGAIIIKHKVDNKVFYALYGHITINDFFKNKKVREGETIGFVEKYTSSGVSCPHLHFCIWYADNYPPAPYGYVDKLQFWVDPLVFL